MLVEKHSMRDALYVLVAGIVYSIEGLKLFYVCLVWC